MDLNVKKYVIVEFEFRNPQKPMKSRAISHSLIFCYNLTFWWPLSMTLTSDQLKTVIIELGVLEDPIIDTKIMKLAHLGAEI